MRAALVLLSGVIGIGGCASPRPPVAYASLPAAATPQAQPDACNRPNYTWVSCVLPAVGSLQESARRRGGQLASFWRSDCGCGAGLAQGRGEARWCEPITDGEPCSLDARLGTAFGVVANGRFAGNLELKTALGDYLGDLDSSGGYQLGVLEKSLNEKFIGRFHADGNYQSGTLYQDGKLYISNRFQQNRPLGTVMIGTADGGYAIYDCATPTSCRLKDKGKSVELGEIWTAASDVVLGKLTVAAREKLATHFGLLRRSPYALSFDVALQMALNALRGS